MNLTFKRTICLFVMLLFASKMYAQTLAVEYRKGHFNEAKTEYHFELWLFRGAEYDVTNIDMSNWIAMNIRTDIEMPPGVTIVDPMGTGVTTNSTYASDGGISIGIAGAPPVGSESFSINMLRNSNQVEIPDITGAKIADCVLTFSAPMSASSKITVRPYDGTFFGAAWTNEVEDGPRRPLVGQAGVALPVNLISFVAAKEGNAATFNWETTEESNSDHFDIQRSNNGKHWTTLFSVKAQGESNVLHAYHAIDNDPLNGENLYRLNMVDKDGSSALSEVQSLRFDVKSDVAIYPNPVSDQITIKAADWSSVSKVQIYNANGLEVYKSGAQPLKQINVKDFNAGMYVVKVTGKNDKVSSYKILVTQ